MQRAECQEIASAWGGIKLIIVSEPRVSKTGLGHTRLELAVPELYLKQEVAEPLRTVLLRLKHSPHYDELSQLAEKLQLVQVKSLGMIPIELALLSPSRLMWEHNGVCPRGRRTYLLSQCFKSLKQRLQGRQEEELNRGGDPSPDQVAPDREYI